jgi:hypothetical protein
MHKFHVKSTYHAPPGHNRLSDVVLEMSIEAVEIDVFTADLSLFEDDPLTKSEILRGLTERLGIEHAGIKICVISAIPINAEERVPVGFYKAAIDGAEKIEFELRKQAKTLN